MKLRIVPKGKKELRNAAIRWLILLLVVGGTLGYIIYMPLKSFNGVVGNYSQQEKRVAENCKKHVQYLADTIGPRTVHDIEILKKAEEYITSSFQSFGFTVSKQFFKAEGADVCNIEVEIKGSTKPEEIVVVGAHYDSHFDTPGADDNASGVAALLELARLFKEKTPARTIRFVAFVNEEPPFFGTEAMGSYQYARRCFQRNENITAMFALETMGYYTSEPHSQEYPFIFGLFYPNKGDFIAFVSNMSSAGMTRRSIKSFRSNCDFPSMGLAAPGWIKGIGWSDQWAFWEFGYKGIMITDTAPYRNHNYHLSTDSSEKLNYNYLARVITGVENVLMEFTTK